MSRESDYITEVRNATKALWKAINDLKTLQREWNALDYGNTLDPGEGENAGIVRTQVGAVVFDSANAFVTLLDQGHGTNLARLL